METSIQTSVMKAALMGIDDISDLEEKILSDDEEQKSVMFSFRYMDMNFSALHASNGDDEAAGINFRTVVSMKLKTKKTRIQLLNDINSFNHSKLGSKVVLLSAKDRDVKLSFDFETWTFNEFINARTTKVAIEFLLFALSLFKADHKYVV